MSVLILFTIFVLYLPVNSKAEYSNNSLKRFDKSCDESRQFLCDISFEVLCTINNKCVCVRNTDINFDLHTRNCVRLANSKCEEINGIGDNVNIPCTAGATCVIIPGQDRLLSASRMCKCSEGYVTDNTGRCTAIRRQNPVCSTNDDCGLGMTCSNNRCVCVDQEDMIYDEISQSCKSLVDTACFLSPIGGVIKNCVNNAECIADNPLVGYCKCRTGFDPTSDRLCVWDGESPTDPPISSTTVATTRQSSTTPEPMTSTTPRVTSSPTPNPGPGLIGQPCEVEPPTTETDFNETTTESDLSDTRTESDWDETTTESGGEEDFPQCIPNAFCSMGKCACEKGYVPQNAKKCVPSGRTGGASFFTSTPLLIICIKIALHNL